MVAGWQVDPGGVRVVLDGVDAGEQTAVPALKNLGDRLEVAAGATGSGEVVAAVQGFAQARAGDVALIRRRVPSAKQAVTDAANAVAAGDDEMAASTQAAAASVWGSDVDDAEADR